MAVLPLLITLLPILICSLLVYQFFLSLYSKSTSKLPYKNYPLLGGLPSFIKNRHRFLDWVAEGLALSPNNTLVFRHPAGANGVLTANPLNVEYMVKTNFDNYPKGVHFTGPLEDLLGKGIFNSDGEEWRMARKTASYEFSTKSLRNFVMECVTVEIQTRLIPLLKNAAETYQVLDVQKMLERFAFDNICKLAFNIDPGCLSNETKDRAIYDEFMDAFEEAAQISSDRFLYIAPIFYKIKKFFNMGSEKRLKQAVSIVHGFAEKMIRSRMEEDTEREGEDLLSRFMVSHGNSSTSLRDTITSFILAGRDTTSTALTWFFWVLSTRPDVEENIVKELETIRSRSGKQIGDSYSFDELREMHYLHAAISEAMRLYPPAPLDTRTCKEDDVLPDGTIIKKGWFITYYTYAMGRMETIWGRDWHEYKPERWLENGIYQKESPFKYPVFHAGPRMCIGKDLAYIQMKSIAASVVERFRMEVLLEKGKCPEHVLAMTFRMKGGLPINVKERHEETLIKLGF